MSWLSSLEQKVEHALGIGDEGGAKEGTEGAESAEQKTQFSAQGQIPPVSNETKQPAPTASQRAYRDHLELEHQPKEHKADTWKGEEWIANDDADPSFTGEQEGKVTSITKQQLYDEITKVAPSLPHEFKILLVGHAWVEQQGKGVLNNNFAGVEGSSTAFVYGWTSAVISTATYEADPSKYRDWDMNGHNPRFGVYGGKDCGTIKVQTDRDPKPSHIVVCERKKRPAYKTLTQATAAFIRLIETRVRSLEASTKPEHRELAEKALAGDAHAYAQIVNGNFDIKDDAGKSHSFGAYNGDKGYGGRVEAQIAQAEQDLPKKEAE